MAPKKSSLRLKVQVWIYAQDKKGNYRYLILKTRPERGDFWQPVTGSVEEGEDVEEAAAREAAEETGLTFVSPPVSLKKNFEFEARGKTFREYGFAAQAREIQPPVLDSHEHTDYQWVDAQEATDKVKFESNIQMLETLLKMQGARK